MKDYRQNYNTNFSFIHGGSKPPPYDEFEITPPNPNLSVKKQTLTRKRRICVLRDPLKMPRALNRNGRTLSALFIVYLIALARSIIFLKRSSSLTELNHAQPFLSLKAHKISLAL